MKITKSAKQTVVPQFYRSLLFFIVSLLLSTTLQARQLGDVSLDDTVTLKGSNTMLQLNGMGYRTKFIFKIYVGALYTEKKAQSATAVLAQKGAKRIVMHIVYDKVSKQKMVNAWNEGLEDNSSEQAIKKLASRIKTFVNFFPDLVENDVVILDYVPNVGTQVVINKVVKGMIKGEDFIHALLKVWLGDSPVDDELKDAMLGIEEE